jgi:hypothetical protein
MNSKNIILISILLSISYVVSGQAPNNKAKLHHLSGKIAEATFDLLTFDRSRCYGECPSYTIVVRANGYVTYEGRKFVKILGLIQSKLSKGQIKILNADVARSRFFTLQNSYGDEKDGCASIGSDHQWITISVMHRKHTKTVKHYLGCYSGRNEFNRELRRLVRLERRIAEVGGVELWTGKQE